MQKINKNQLGGSASVFVILGQVGTGKTSIIRSHAGKKVLFSFDDSYEVIQDWNDDEIESIETYGDITSQDIFNIDKFLSEATELTKDADLIVFDNISALEGILVDDMSDGKVGNNRNLQAAYGATQKVLRKMVRWAVQQHKDVIFTLWSKVADGFEKPAMNDNAFNSMAGYAKIVGRTFKDSQGYRVALQPSLSGVAKNRINKLDKINNKDFWKATQFKETNKQKG